jgi:hypothetical protein
MLLLWRLLLLVLLVLLALHLARDAACRTG